MDIRINQIKVGVIFEYRDYFGRFSAKIKLVDGSILEVVSDDVQELFKQLELE